MSVGATSGRQHHAIPARHAGLAGRTGRQDADWRPGDLTQLAEAAGPLSCHRRLLAMPARCRRHVRALGPSGVAGVVGPGPPVSRSRFNHHADSPDAVRLRTGSTTPGTEWAGASSLPSGVVLGGRRSGDLGRDVPHRRVPCAQTGPCGEQGTDVPEGVEGRAMGHGDDPVGREQRG